MLTAKWGCDQCCVQGWHDQGPSGGVSHCQTSCVSGKLHIHTHTHTHIHTHACMHAHTHTQTHTQCMNIHACTHTHTPPSTHCTYTHCMHIHTCTCKLIIWCFMPSQPLQLSQGVTHFVDTQYLLKICPC